MLQELGLILLVSLGHKPVDLLLDVDPRVPGELVGDALRIQQVLVNLGNNAVKFTERGEVRVGLRLLEQRGSRFSFQLVLPIGDGACPLSASPRALAVGGVRTVTKAAAAAALLKNQLEALGIPAQWLSRGPLGAGLADESDGSSAQGIDTLIFDVTLERNRCCASGWGKRRLRCQSKPHGPCRH